ncbi:MAG: hypothetical protein AABY64_10870 [Bdellovibrionota bacterium]
MGTIFRSHKVNGYCAFCRSPHWHYRQKSLGSFHIVMSLATAAVMSIYIFGELDPRLCLFFVSGLCLSEIFTQIRWRLSLVCRQCGFDPVTYKKDPNQAVNLVKSRLERRQQSTSWALRPIHLPTLTAERAISLQKTENQPRLSKQI